MAMTISRTTARARLEAAGFGSPNGLLYTMFSYDYSCDESVTCQEMKHITLPMNKRLPNPEQNIKGCKHNELQDRLTTKDVEENFPGPVSRRRTDDILPVLCESSRNDRSI
jgi:hypothetical protein